MPDLPKYPHELLPPTLREGQRSSPVNNLLRTEMQSGRAKQRPRYRNTPTHVAATWLFRDPGQAQLFEAWYLDVLSDGAKWFEMNMRTPQGVLPYKFRFTSIYEGPIRISPAFWQYTATLEQSKRAVTGDGWALYYPEALRYGNIIDVALNREWPEP